MKLIISIVAVVVVILVIGAVVWYFRMPSDKAALKLINEVVSKIAPVERDANIAYWNATTTGEKKWYDEYEKKDLEYRLILADKETFKKIESFRGRRYKDPLVKRQIEVLYLDALKFQIPEEMNKELVKRETALTEKFNTFRAKIDGKEVTDNEIRGKLKTSTDMEERRKIWEGSKQIGKAVSNDMVELVKLRNKAAKLLGYKNYYVMRLELQEIGEVELYEILDELASFTKKPFADLKAEIDTALAKRYGISVEDIRPWHYEDVFFQETPQVFNVDLDSFFKGKDVVQLVKKYYDSMGLPAGEILKRSDLFEKKGKEQHAYCTDIDRNRDIRILANVKDDLYWTGTMLHELGHAVYDDNISLELPWLLRAPAHIFTTEAIAEMFGSLVYYPEWLKAVVGAEGQGTEIDAVGDKMHKVLRAQMLIFARWVLVMANFERALYANPDQNLNELWWNMVDKYQMVHGPYGRNEPDWAAKIHFSTAPVYYHNYILGEMLSAQIMNYVNKNVSNGGFAFVNNHKLGPYLIEKIFVPGDRLRWNVLVESATGEPLNPKYFADRYAK